MGPASLYHALVMKLTVRILSEAIEVVEMLIDAGIGFWLSKSLREFESLIC